MKLARVFMLFAVMMMALFTASPAFADPNTESCNATAYATTEWPCPKPRIIPPVESAAGNALHTCVNDPDNPNDHSCEDVARTGISLEDVVPIAAAGLGVLAIILGFAILIGRRNDPTQVPQEARPFL